MKGLIWKVLVVAGGINIIGNGIVNITARHRQNKLLEQREFGMDQQKRSKRNAKTAKKKTETK